MNTLAVINGIDITPYMDWGKFKIKPEEVYESWEDGNRVEHRIYTRTKLSGSFNVWLCGINGMDTNAFKTLIGNATNNHVTTMGLYDQTTNSLKAINAFIHLEPVEHKEMVNGDYFDVFKVEVQER